MIYKYPNYYKEFKCTGADCQATCCAGWEIVIDEESIEKYDEVTGEFGKRLRNSIDYNEEVFHQDELKRCAFLNKENLCDIYSNIGEEYLCDTCTNYPRHLEEFEGMNEMSLSISCPEVAKIILDKVDKIDFFEEEVDELEEEYEDFDFMFFDIVYNVRDVIIEIIQDRSIEQITGMRFLLNLIEKVQDFIDRDKVFEIESMVEDEISSWKNDSVLCNSDRKTRQEVMETYLKDLEKLEVLDETWVLRRDAYIECLYENDNLNYTKDYIEFRDEINIEIEKEQLFVYFIYSYFCGCVYDGDALAKFKIALINTFIIEEMWFAKWIINGKKISRDELYQITYTYAREIEHSDMNLDALEKIYNTSEDYTEKEIQNIFI